MLCGQVCHNLLSGKYAQNVAFRVSRNLRAFETSFQRKSEPEVPAKCEDFTQILGDADDRPEVVHTSIWYGGPHSYNIYIYIYIYMFLLFIIYIYILCRI